MKYGDLVTIALQGEFGKPRPALVIQSNNFSNHSTITVLLLTSTIVEAPLIRMTLEPNSENNLQKTSQIMIDKTMTIRREKMGEAFGFLNRDVMLEVRRLLAVFLNFT
jgi:mRNA interferase MazF